MNKKPDKLMDMLGSFGNAASQAQSKVAADQAETYKNGPWWNFLQFTGMRCGPQDVLGPGSLFRVARSAMSMQCMMYGGEVIERLHNLKCSKENFGAFAKENNGRIMYSDCAQGAGIEYFFVFPRSAVHITTIDPPRVHVLTSSPDLAESINGFLKKLKKSDE